MGKSGLLAGTLVLLALLTGASRAAAAPEDPATLNARIIELYQQGRYQEALPLAEKLVRLSEATLGPEHQDTATSLNNLAALYVSVGDYSRAEPLYQRALALREKVLGPEHSDTAATLNNLALLYVSTGDYSRAEPHFQRALAIWGKVLGPEHPDTATTLNNLALLYVSTGDYSRAEPLYQRALAIREKVLGPEHPDTAATLNNLAEFYQLMGDYARAESLHQRALALREKVLGPEHPGTAVSLNDLAELYKSMGDYARAEPLYRRALAIWEKALGPEHPATAISLSNLATLYVATGDRSRAEPLYQRALAIREKALGPEHPDTAASLSNLAGLLDSTGDHARAEPLYQRALAIQEKVLGPQHPNTAATLNNLAYLQIDLGRPEAALALARRAREAEEGTLANVLSFTSERQRLAYQATLDPYALPATLGSAPDLARAILRFKGVVLDSLVEDLRLAEASQDPVRRARVEELRAFKRRLLQLTLEVPGDRSSEARRRREEERRKLEQEVERREGELAREVAGLGRARGALSVTAEQVQAALPRGWVLVELVRHRFYLGKGRLEERYGAAVLAREGPPRWVVLGPAEDLDRQVRACQRAIQASAPDQALSRRLRALYDTLWAPLEKGLPADTIGVLLSPDGELNFLSWATLLTPEDRFLAEDYELRYVSSGRDLLEAVGPPAGSQAIALGAVDFGSPPAGAEASGTVPARGLGFLEQRDLRALGFAPLPGTGAEVEALEKLLREEGWKVEVARGRQASEAWLASARSPGLLHLATHGYFLPTLEMTPPRPGAEPAGLEGWEVRLVNPMHRSGLALAGAQNTLEAWKRGQTPPPANDGLLTAEEVGTLKLAGTWLVTLSACETGRGEARAGEGVLGLRRGFVQAGARNLLMTLWPVADEETARFMADFYRKALKDGRAPAALARTQREWLVRLRREKGLTAAVFLAGPFLLSFQGKP
jgi:CHAT domain-containing protein/Tfp pilus assembly protein PilF